MVEAVRSFCIFFVQKGTRKKQLDVIKEKDLLSLDAANEIDWMKALDQGIQSQAKGPSY